MVRMPTNPALLWASHVVGVLAMLTSAVVALVSCYADQRSRISVEEVGLLGP
jgi:ABC-type spermidine/putrescine transport system permease subunit II